MGSEPGCATNSRRWSLVGFPLWEPNTGPLDCFVGLRGPSMWISHVKAFSEANNIPYKEALKAAGPSYQKLKAQM